MMKKANVGKPKADWKPPQGYISALGNARDEAKAKAKKVKSIIDNETENDSASEDDDTYSQVGQSFTAHALTPFSAGQKWNKLVVSSDVLIRTRRNHCSRECI